MTPRLPDADRRCPAAGRIRGLPVPVEKHLVAWIRQESSRIRHLWKLTDSEVSSLFSGLAYPCNKVAPSGISFERQEGAPAWWRGLAPVSSYPDAAQAGDRCNKVLWQDKSRASADVKCLALDHVREINAKIEALITMRDAVQALAAACEGDHRPDCPILEDLERCGEPVC